MSKRVDWLAIQLEYEAGGVTLKDLAAKYQVSKRTIERHSANGKWTEKARNTSNQVAEKVRTGIVDKGVEKNLSHLEIINTVIRKSYEAFMELEFKTAGEAITALDKMLKYDHQYIIEWLLKRGYIPTPISPEHEDPESDLNKLLSFPTEY